MSFQYFSQSAFPFFGNYSNYEAFPTYPNQMTGFMTTIPQAYSEFNPWGQIFQTESYSIMEKPCAITQLRTTDDSSESEVVVNTNRGFETLKKREKKTVEKDISSAKKNSQSNIINQFYSFFSCRDRSEKIVKKAIDASIPGTKFQQKIMSLFYNMVKAINSKRGRKYVNRSMMLNYFTPDMLIEHLPEFKEKFQKIDFICLDQICQIFRRACHAFFKIISIPAVMTSKRITGVSKEEHFKKRRIILKAITGY